MASKSFVNIDLIGEKKTTALLRRLPLYLQKNVVTVSLKEAFRPALAALQREAMGIEKGGGRLAAVAAKTKLKAIRRRRGNLGWRLLLPKRVQLGISQSEKYYYPYAVEFGGKYTAPNPFIYRALMSSRHLVIKKATDLIYKGVRLGWESRA